MMPLDDAHMCRRHFEDPGDDLHDTPISGVCLGFFANADLKTIVRDFIDCLFRRMRRNLHFYVQYHRSFPVYERLKLLLMRGKSGTMSPGLRCEKSCQC